MGGCVTVTALNTRWLISRLKRRKTTNIYAYLGQWDVSLDPIKQTVLTEVHIMQSTIVRNCSGRGCSSTGMAAAVILTSRTVFANHLPRIGILSGNNGSTCVCRERSMTSFYLFSYIFMIFYSDTGLFSLCRRHLTLCLQGMASDLSLFLISARHHHAIIDIKSFHWWFKPSASVMLTAQVQLSMVFVLNKPFPWFAPLPLSKSNQMFAGACLLHSINPQFDTKQNICSWHAIIFFASLWQIWEDNKCSTRKTNKWAIGWGPVFLIHP